MNELWKFLETVAQTPRFTLIAGAASMFGFVFSLLAWVRAGRASKAAKEARDAVTLLTVADELQIACQRLDQLLDFVKQDRIPEAALRAQELVTVLSEVPYRRGAHLDETRQSELLNARTQLQEIHVALASSRKTLTTDEKRTFIEICLSVDESLRKNLGIIKGEIDRGAKQ